MASAMDDCVLDFDIGLLHQSSKYELEKALHTIRVLKTKVTRTSDVLKKYYAKVAECKQLENLALSTKEDYQQVCMENLTFREQSVALEEEIKKAQEGQKILREQYNTVLNQYEGIQSHSKQLELLVKENETTIQSLKIENQLEKATSKDSEKKCAALQKEIDHLKTNVCRVRAVVLGKKKVSKEVKIFLNKYGSPDTGNENHGENSSDDDTFEDCLSPLGAEVDNVKNINNEDDSQSSTGVVSSDTGRGSSLACSLAGSILSPEYFIHHSPTSGEIVASKNKMIINIATSPVLTREFNSVATSPIIFDDFSKPMEFEDSKTSPIDKVVSLTQYSDMATSTDRYVTCESSTSPLKGSSGITDSNFTSDQNQEEAHSDIDNINDLDDESNDGEIQMIFDTMRFNQNLITPIPTTPAKSRTEAAANIATQTMLHTAGVCPDAVKLKEDNVALKDTVDKLAQQVTNMNDTFMKCFLSIIDANAMNTEAQKLLRDKCSLEENGKNELKPIEPKTPVSHTEETTDKSEGTKHKCSLEENGKNQLKPIEPKTPVSHTEETTDKSEGTKHNCSLEENGKNQLKPIEHKTPVSHTEETTDKSEGTTHKCSLEENGKNQLKQIEPKTPVSHKEQTTDKSEGTKKKFGFKNRLSKIKDLFDDSSPPSPSGFVVPKPPITLCRSPSPAPGTASTSPPPSPLSSRPPSISPPPANTHENTSNNSNIENVSFNSKDRLDFEDPLLDEGQELSDEEMYEHEIVVELAPDSNESDRSSLHAILMEQQLKTQAEPGNKPIKRSPKKVPTKLDRLRKNMAPKSKIAKETLPGRKNRKKLRIQPKRLTANKQRVLDKSVCAIDDETAYEKACKVMAEIKSKEKVAKTTPNVTRRNNARKSLKYEKCALNEDDIRTKKHDDSMSNDNVVILEKISPNKLPEKCSVESRMSLDSVEEDNQNKDTLATLSKPNETKKKCIPAGKDVWQTELKKPVTTRSLTKSEQDCISPVSNFNIQSNIIYSSNQLNSPALKRYTRIINNSNKNETNNNNTQIQSFVQDNSVITDDENSKTEAESDSRKRLKRPACDKPNIVPKRLLRSSSIQEENEDKDNPRHSVDQNIQTKLQTEVTTEIVSYEDLDLFNNSEDITQAKPDQTMPTINHSSTKPGDSKKPGILCTFIDKYGSKSMKRSPKTSDNTINTICKLLEDGVEHIQKLPPKDTKHAMDQLVKELKSRPQNNVICGLTNFLKEPARKIESYNKINVPPAPPMTKVEQILIYVVAQLKLHWPSVVESILSYIEYTLFMLNRTPEFDVIESLSHFYAVLCRYNKNRNRLRLFVIDAMYCLQYKAVPLIKQCLDVWMHILPLAHLGLAKNPLVTCLVYLLHFYKCEDKFNRVQEIRNILHRKYFYEVSEWNEPGILEMLRNCILELRDIPGEKKMIRMSLIILAKRNGAQWCQKHIIKNMLLSIIEQTTVPDRIKQFCVALLGPLLKPFPMEMKVNCEIVMNQLFDILEQNPTPQMEEAIFTSLIYMSRHNTFRVIRALLCWTPESVTPEFEELLKNYVRERPVKSWRQVVSKIFIYN